ncbi:Uncharacterised protein [Neisseria dentiae]|nr:Uncharacterised protein [Neisseria dentiae]
MLRKTVCWENIDGWVRWCFQSALSLKNGKDSKISFRHQCFSYLDVPVEFFAVTHSDSMFPSFMYPSIPL